jgi:hypothetical protein
MKLECAEGTTICLILITCKKEIEGRMILTHSISPCLLTGGGVEGDSCLQTTVGLNTLTN